LLDRFYARPGPCNRYVASHPHCDIAKQLTRAQQVRRYASEAPKTEAAPNKTVLYAGIAAAALSGSYIYLRRGNPMADVKPVSTGPAKKAFTGGDQGFVSLVLEKSEIVNHNTKKLTFKLPEEDMESGLPVASAVITKYKGPEMQKPVIRPYTPISDVDQQGTVDFIIKKYPNGPMSSHMHDMRPGQSLDIKGPIPKYQWTPNKQYVCSFLTFAMYTEEVNNV
jgi:cytochrome-b5 reductase